MPNANNSSNNNAELLDGFEIVASDATPVITLDSQRRFYINSTARRLIDASPYVRLSIAYHADNKEIAIVRPAGYHGDASELSTSSYNVDKRYYMSARHFAKTYGYKTDKAPYTFAYDRGASDGSAFIFTLRPLAIVTE